MTKPSIGRIVHYTLSDGDAVVINKRRADAYESKIASENSGAVVHFGNTCAQGDVFPMMITRVWNQDPGTVNGQVLLDGNDTYWATSRVPGEGPGSYAWPVRE